MATESTLRLPVWIFALATALSVGGCNCDNGGPSIRPDGGDDGGVLCTSCPIGTTCAPDGTCQTICNDGRDACVSEGRPFCCAANKVCFDGSCEFDCGTGFECNGTCCDAGDQCFDGQCATACADTGQLCGENLELCCPDGDICINNQCATPGDDCLNGDDCALDEICDPSINKCIPRTLINECVFIPPVGEFSPTRACRWTPPTTGDAAVDAMAEVVMTPSVANLTDDNGDGFTDTRDTPDIVFTSFDFEVDQCCTGNGVVRIASGACNPDGTMDTLATLRATNEQPIENSGGIALGNLHPASMTAEAAPEIVATYRSGADRGVVAWTRTADDGSAWQILWDKPTVLTSARLHAGGQPSLADVNGDGQPEVVLGNVVLNGLDGSLVWDGAVTVGPTAGQGNNAFLGPSSTVADIDLDGVMEVVAGNTVYNGPDGTEEWTFTLPNDPSSPCGKNANGPDCDGYNGVANFDSDDEAEVVLVWQGEIIILEHDGTLKQRIAVPYDDCVVPFPLPNTGEKRNESGPPTIADFDGDGMAEVGSAGADFYVVYDLQCTGTPLPADCESEFVRWTVANRDCSSRATASSVFDFEGDGKAEVVYADETRLRVFSGLDGSELYSLPHSSNTRVEMPVVVDVDNDGKSEMVIPEPNHDDPNEGGIEIYADADNNWVRTRRIWNQHAYHVTNITEDGQVPADEPENWLDEKLNNFRQNVQPNGLFDAPDFYVDAITRGDCPGGAIEVKVKVGNKGALSIPPGLPVYLTVTTPGGMTLPVAPNPPAVTDALRTATWLLPGTTETIVFAYTPPSGVSRTNLVFNVVIDADGSGGSEYNECDEGNNALSSNPLSCTVVE